MSENISRRNGMRIPKKIPNNGNSKESMIDKIETSKGVSRCFKH